MLFAATRAPSGSNRQPFRFLVLTDSDVAHDAKALVGRAARGVCRLIGRTSAAGDGDNERSVGEPLCGRAERSDDRARLNRGFDRVVGRVALTSRVCRT